jgi:hypothetical protein
MHECGPGGGESGSEASHASEASGMEVAMAVGADHPEDGQAGVASGAVAGSEWQQAYDPTTGYLYYYREATQASRDVIGVWLALLP